MSYIVFVQIPPNNYLSTNKHFPKRELI